MHAWVDASYREFSISFTYFSSESVTLILAVAVHLNKVLENILLFSLFFLNLFYDYAVITIHIGEWSYIFESLMGL